MDQLETKVLVETLDQVDPKATVILANQVQQVQKEEKEMSDQLESKVLEENPEYVSLLHHLDTFLSFELKSNKILYFVFYSCS